MTVLLLLSPASAQQGGPARPVVPLPKLALLEVPVVAEVVAPSTAAALPDAPSASTSGEPFGQIANQKEGSQPSLNPLQRLAHPFVPTSSDITVAPGQVGPHQGARDKLVGSLVDSISPFSFAGETISAGYSQGRNSSPNYGSDLGAFGQRVGASVARGTSQKIFSEGLLAVALHEDPRYYQLGSKRNFFKRVVYAATRPVIGRTDGGRTTPNITFLGGYLGAAALAQVYYPASNHNLTNVMQTWGTGLGGNAIGNEITEFLPDALQFLHLKRVEHD